MLYSGESLAAAMAVVYTYRVRSSSSSTAQLLSGVVVVVVEVEEEEEEVYPRSGWWWWLWYEGGEVVKVEGEEVGEAGASFAASCHLRSFLPFLPTTHYFPYELVEMQRHLRVM
jgi:hypothetical protein